MPVSTVLEYSLPPWPFLGSGWGKVHSAEPVGMNDSKTKVLFHPGYQAHSPVAGCFSEQQNKLCFLAFLI